MGDGWETKRSRVKGHKDWVIIKLYVVFDSSGSMRAVIASSQWCPRRS